METIEACQAALFNRAPKIGEVNPEGEVSYAGYSRVPFPALYGTNVSAVEFPPSEQDEPILVTHVVSMDVSGKVVGVKAI